MHFADKGARVDKSGSTNEKSGGAEGIGENAPGLQGIASLEAELSVAADLAYLKLDEGERRAFAVSVGRMLEFFAKMDEFPSDGGGGDDTAASNKLRADMQSAFAGPDPIELASQREGRFVGIPNIL
jgi:Asp-tRNA(Asn)/Glu-tRNA(Gln) amidotransferase C subunit